MSTIERAMRKLSGEPDPEPTEEVTELPSAAAEEIPEQPEAAQSAEAVVQESSATVGAGKFF